MSRHFKSTDSFVEEEFLCLEGSIIYDNEEYEDFYAGVEVSYSYSRLDGIPYEDRVYAQSYEEDIEITDVTLIETFIWNGKTYTEGTSVYDYPELNKFLDEEKLEEIAIEKAHSEYVDDLEGDPDAYDRWRDEELM